ncbi:hypothetical protein [Oleisolibacter albus]|uniref:hypothetical protein n=1 Tax=Oleisolibacter albus TaxID=2171757 RepID=UPI000DF37542|nr:hypothetical protein [Oleisolibacter albus]
MTSVFHSYRAMGLGITAPFPCPGFFPGAAPVAGRVVTLALGPVPTALQAPVAVFPLVQFDAAGRCLHEVPGIGRYLIHDRHHVTIEVLAPDGLARALRFFRGIPLAILCLRWGLVPLEATCIGLKDGALLLGGGTCGKSSLALALARQGYPLLADEGCALEMQETGEMLVWPSFPDVSLWPDSLEAAGLVPPAGAAGAGGRFVIDATGWFSPEPRPPVALCRMHRVRGGVVAPLIIHEGIRAFQLAMNMVSAGEMCPHPGAARGAFGVVTRLVAGIPVYECASPDGADGVLKTLHAVLADRMPPSPCTRADHPPAPHRVPGSAVGAQLSLSRS